MNESAEHPPVVKRMPIFPDTHRASIDEYLTFLRDKIELSLNNHRVLAMQDKSARTTGMVRYLRNQLATLNWAIELNAMRRSVNRGKND